MEVKYEKDARNDVHHIDHCRIGIWRVSKHRAGWSRLVRAGLQYSAR